MKVGNPSPVPVVGADHLVPRQENNPQAQQNLNILSTHYVSPRTHQELLGLQLRDRQADIYGHVFGASGNDDIRRRVGNAHAALLRVLDRPGQQHVQDLHTRRFDQLGQAATRGKAVGGDLAKMDRRGRATKFVAAKLIQGAAVMENAVELDVGISWRVKVSGRDGSDVVKRDASLGRSLSTRAFENLPLAFAGAYVASQGLAWAHDRIRPTYFTGIGAKRRNLAAAAEQFRADSEKAAGLRAGGNAAKAIVQTYGEGGRDFLESAMNEVDRSVYDYMVALQRQAPGAMPPDEEFAITGVTSASLQATYARLQEARFINAFSQPGQGRHAVVQAWRPQEDLPGAGVLLRATVGPAQGAPSTTRVRNDRSAEDPSCAESDPPRWDYRPALSAALAEVGRFAGQVPDWGGYLRMRKDLVLARQGHCAALARLGALCEDGPVGEPGSPSALRLARALYEAAAEGGDLQGQYRLGRMHARGQAGRPAEGPREPAAVKWLTLAAERGHAQAQAELGVLHVAGRTGLDADAAAAQGRRWCEKAVAAGVRSAELFLALGRLYEDGRIVGISEEKRGHRCRIFYAEAAGEGHVIAQRCLGLLYLHGMPGQEDARGDDASAARYLRMAVAQNDAISAWHLAEMYREGRAAPAQGEGTAQEEMVRCLTLAADGGHRMAQFALGVLHAHGRATAVPTQPDFEQAARRYRQAGAQGHMEAQFDLAKLLLKGVAAPVEGTDRAAEAVHWCRLAAEQGKLAAQVLLASLHEAGQAGVKPGPAANQKMAQWLQCAAEQGDRDLQYRLAEYYFKGTAGLETGDEALRIAAGWYERAAAQGHTLAQHRLGALHAQGKAGLAAGQAAGARAVALWTEAAAAGHGPSMFELAGLYAKGLAAAPAGQDPGIIAARWYRAAAASGQVQALYELGRLHEQGRTGLDAMTARAAAVESFRLAAEGGHEPARQRLEELQRSAAAQPEPADEPHSGTEPEDSPRPVVQELTPALRRSRRVRWGDQKKAGEAGTSTSAADDADVRPAKAAAAKASAGNAGQEMFTRGRELMESSKDPVEIDRGYRLMVEAASKGDPDLQYQLASLYAREAGDAPAGPRRAMKISTLLTQAAEQGHPAAMHMLAHLYLKERYIDSRTRLTVRGAAANKAAQGFLEKCVELGDAHSMALLGWMYETGRAGSAAGHPDRDKAREHYRQAAAAGSDYAKQRVEAM